MDVSASSHSSINEDEDQDLPSQSEPESELKGIDETSASPPTKGFEEPEDLSSTLWKTRGEDRKKGKAVARQVVRLD